MALTSSRLSLSFFWNWSFFGMMRCCRCGNYKSNKAILSCIGRNYRRNVVFCYWFLSDKIYTSYTTTTLFSLQYTGLIKLEGWDPVVQRALCPSLGYSCWIDISFDTTEPVRNTSLSVIPACWCSCYSARNVRTNGELISRTGRSPHHYRLAASSEL